MQRDYLHEVFDEIAQSLGRPRDSLSPFEDILRENWVDTREALAQMDEASFQNLGLPLMLQKKLLEKARSAPLEKSAPRSPAPKPQGDTPLADKPPSKPQKEEFSESQITALKDSLDLIYRTTLGSENLLNTYSLIHTLFTNLATNPTVPKYRTLNLANPKLSILNTASVQSLFKLVGFRPGENSTIVLPEEASLQGVEYSLALIFDYEEKLQKSLNNVGVAGFTSTTGQPPAPQSGDKGIWVGDALENLKMWRRSQLKPTCERNTHKVKLQPYTEAGGVRIGDPYAPVSKPLPDELSADEERGKVYLSPQERKELMKRFQDGPQFVNKRRAELEHLINAPVFTETAIRFRLPDGTMLQSQFSPLEKVHHLREELLKYFTPPPGQSLYLYTAPPPVRLEQKKFLTMTLEELNLVPRAIVHVGLE